MSLNEPYKTMKTIKFSNSRKEEGRGVGWHICHTLSRGKEKLFLACQGEGVKKISKTFWQSLKSFYALSPTHSTHPIFQIIFSRIHYLTLFYPFVAANLKKLLRPFSHLSHTSDLSNNRYTFFNYQSTY